VTDRFICSAASIERDEPVRATASQVQGWLMIEVPGAWGVDAIHESELGVHLPEGWAAGLKRRGIRPLCIRPQHRDAGHHGTRVFFVTSGRPGRTRGAVWTRVLPTLAAAHYLSEGLHAEVDPPDGWTRHDERLVIVCTNGRHDQCCATRGRPVVRRLRESPWTDQVWECSHIGGDRFAANLVVLPDALYFGRMEPDEAVTILDDHAAGRIGLAHYRGRASLRFIEQAAEHAVRQRYGVGGIDDVAVGLIAGTRRVRATVRGVGTLEVTIQRSEIRTHEALTCHGSPNQVIPVFEAVAFSDPEPE
jgi:hypothetical protein